MEGFLLKKGKGESSFGRRNWKKRWFILEGQKLSYYEDLDKNFAPVGLKGSIDVKGCEVAPAEHKDKQFVFTLKPLNDHAVQYQAMDQKSFNGWIKALSFAALEEEAPDIEEDYQLLGLSSSANPPASEVNRAFRKAALKAHPDKGGDMAEFKRLQDACNKIMTKLEDDEKEKLYTYVQYTAVITKNHGDAGLGLIVVEDPLKKTIKIKEVMAAIKIESLSPEASGQLRVGDVLVGVANETVELMPLTRVAQKLNEFRVPAGKQVKLTFKRRLNLDGTELPADAADAAEAEEKKEEHATAESKHAADPTDTAGTAPTNSTDVGDMDIDENIKTFTEEEEAANHLHQQQQQQHHTQSYGYGHGPAPMQPLPAHSRRPSAAGHQPPVVTVRPANVNQAQLLSENEELKAELAMAKDDLDSLRQAMQSYQQENDQLKGQVQKHSANQAAENTRKLYLEQVLKQTVTQEHVHQMRRNILKVAEAIVNQEPVEVSEEVEIYLTNEQLSMVDCAQDAQKMAYRRAISTVGMTDNGNQRALAKWALQGDSALMKLQRFAEKVNNMQLPTN